MASDVSVFRHYNVHNVKEIIMTHKHIYKQKEKTTGE